MIHTAGSLCSFCRIQFEKSFFQATSQTDKTGTHYYHSFFILWIFFMYSFQFTYHDKLSFTLIVAENFFLVLLKRGLVCSGFHFPSCSK